MGFNSNFEQPKAIYRQIVDQVCESVASGKFNFGDKLPTIREMSEKLQVNPNTTARSYAVLVDMGITENRRGHGYFVTEGAYAQILQKMKTNFVEDDLPRIFATMHKVGMTIEELVALYHKQSIA